MSDFDPIEIELAINSPEVLKQAVEVDNTLKGLDKTISSTEARFKKYTAEQLKATTATTKHTPNVRVAKREFDSLGHSINQITRELPAFTYSAQTGLMAISNNIPMLADEILRLKQRNEELTASGQKGVPVWKQLIKSAFSWQSVLSIGVTLLTIYGKEIGNFFLEVFKGKKTMNEFKEVVKSLNEAYKATEYKKARMEVVKMTAQIQLAKEGKLKAITVVDNYNKSLGKVIGSVNTLKEAESKLIAKGDAYVKMMFYKSAATAFLQSSNDEVIELVQKEIDLQEKLKGAKETLNQWKGASHKEDVIKDDSGKIIAVNSEIAERRKKSVEQSVNKIKSELEDLEKSQSNVYQKILAKASDIAKKFNIKLYEAEADKPKLSKHISSRKQLLQKLADLDAEYSRKQLTKNDEELQALRDKFGKVRKLVKEFNSKNKAKINLTGLDELQQKAEGSLRYRQNTQELFKQLENEKDLFASYEALKTKVSKEEADKRYGYLLKGFDNYGDFLKSKQEELQTELNGKDKKNLTGAELERLSKLTKTLNNYKKNQSNLSQKNFVDAYQKIITHEEKILKIKSDYALRKIELEKITNKSIREAKLKELEHQKEKAIVVAYAEEYEKKRVFESTRLKDLENEREFWSEKLKLSKKGTDRYIAIQRKVANVNKQLNEYLFKQTSNLLDEMTHFFDGIGDSGMAKFIDELKSVTDSLSGVYNSFNDEKSSTIDKTTSLVGLIIAASDIASQIGEAQLNKVVNRQIEKNKGLEAQIVKERTINEIRQRRLELEMNSSAFLKANFNDEFKNSLEQQIEAEKRLSDSMKLLSQNGVFSSAGTGKNFWGNSKTENRNFSIKQILGDFSVKDFWKQDGFWIDPIGNLLFGSADRKTKISRDALKNLRKGFTDTLNAMGKTSADMAKFSSREWLDFFSILEKSGNITDETTKKLVAEAKKAEEEYRKALEKMKSVINSVAGSLGNDLKRSLLSAFEAGEDAAQNFKKSVGKVLQNLFLDKLIQKNFRGHFDKLQKDMKDSFGKDGDKSWIDDIKRFSKNVSPEIQRAMEAMKVFSDELKGEGFQGFSNKTSDNSLKGAVKGMTETQADLLAGQFGGLRLTQLTTNKILKGNHAEQLERVSKQIEIQQDIEKNTRRTADNTEKLKSIDKTLTEIKENCNDKTGKANGIP